MFFERLKKMWWQNPYKYNFFQEGFVQLEAVLFFLNGGGLFT